jgi:hypothetical protein
MSLDFVPTWPLFLKLYRHRLQVSGLVAAAADRAVGGEFAAALAEFDSRPRLFASVEVQRTAFSSKSSMKI